MKQLLIIFFLVSAAYLPTFATEGKLNELDKILADRYRYEEVKRTEIDKAKADYARADNDSDRYNILRTLYNAYRTFKIDSALIIADKRLEIARNMGSGSKISSASINLAEGYVKAGEADYALHILDTLNKENLEEYHTKYLNSVYRNAYELKSQTALLPSDRLFTLQKLRELRDKTIKETGKDTKGYYTLSAMELADAGLHKEAITLMEEASLKFDFSKDAAMQYTMADIYLRGGERSKAIDCLANSAILDISSGVKEYRALILLAAILFEDNDMERAFNYINVAFEDANFSNANLRTPEIIKYLSSIDKGFREYEIQNSRRTHTLLWIAIILVVLLAISMVFLLRAFRANRNMIARIEDINSHLEEQNRKLKEADSLKLQNINTLMLSNAKYISRLKDFRKNLYRLMKTGQYEKALDAVKSTRYDSKDINAFHELFDESFLSMFPDFIDSVNRLLNVKVSLKEDGRLTPELRVMALMRLGLSSTEEISGLLQYSVQTVYNLRTTIRSMTDLSKEEFTRRIREL